MKLLGPFYRLYSKLHFVLINELWYICARQPIINNNIFMAGSKAKITDLSAKGEEKAFEIKTIDDDEIDDIDFDAVRMPKMKVTSIEQDEEEQSVANEPKDIIKVKFGTFVQLVASRDVMEVIEAHKDQEIIMSSNLLTELASTSDSREEKKIPIVFLVGIAIGVVLTYIFFST